MLCEELFEHAVAFLPKSYDLWVSGNLALQKLILRLTFADRLAHCPAEGFRTAKTTMPFSLLESLRKGKMELARPTGIEPVFPP